LKEGILLVEKIDYRSRDKLDGTIAIWEFLEILRNTVCKGCLKSIKENGKCRAEYEPLIECIVSDYSYLDEE
jgi:hypothetical protein